MSESDSAGNVVPFKAAEDPVRASMLALLDYMRRGVEDGSIVHVIAIGVTPDRGF